LISKTESRLRLGRLMCRKALPFRGKFVSRGSYASDPMAGGAASYISKTA